MDAAYSAGERNAFMLNLLVNVGNELKALSDNDSRFYDFLGKDSKQTMNIIIQLLRRVPMDKLDIALYRNSSNNEEKHEQKPPTTTPHTEDKNTVLPPVNNQKLILPPPEKKMILPPPAPAQTSEEPKKIQSPPETHDNVVTSMDLKSFLNDMVNLMRNISDNIDNKASDVISMGIGCFVEVTQRAICEINGADLAINAHWNHAVAIMVLVQQTACDLEFWSMSLHKNLSEMFMAIETGLSVTPEQVELGYRNPSGRDVCILSLLAKTGGNLHALSKRVPTFFDFMGPESAKTMQILISLLLSPARH